MPNTEITQLPVNVQLAAMLLTPSGREWLGLKREAVDKLAEIG